MDPNITRVLIVGIITLGVVILGVVSMITHNECDCEDEDTGDGR